MQHAARKPDKPAGTALGDIDLLPNRRDRLAPGLRAQGFPFTTTFRASISSIASASSFFSLAFSASRLLEPTGFRHLHAAELRAPRVERGVTEPMLPAQLLHRQARLRFLQEADDLFFRKRFFMSVFLFENGLY